MDETKSVESFFGQKQVTRAEFVAQWVQEVTQFWSIITTTGDGIKINAMKATVADMAGRKWDELK